MKEPINPKEPYKMVLQNIDFQVQAEETVCILSDSNEMSEGLLKAIAGELKGSDKAT